MMKEFRSKRLRVWENISRTMQEFKVLLLGYRSYTALLTQYGTDAPVATILENTLGAEVVWTRESLGYYKGTLTNGSFPLNKSYIPNYGNWADKGNPYNIIIGAGLSGIEILGYYSIFIDIISNQILIDVLDKNFNSIDLSDLISTTTLYLPEIRIYN